MPSGCRRRRAAAGTHRRGGREGCRRAAVLVRDRSPGRSRDQTLPQCAFHHVGTGSPVWARLPTGPVGDRLLTVSFVLTGCGNPVLCASSPPVPLATSAGARSALSPGCRRDFDAGPARRPPQWQVPETDWVHADVAHDELVPAPARQEHHVELLAQNDQPRVAAIVVSLLPAPIRDGAGNS
jgi:hypothetical protein